MDLEKVLAGLVTAKDMYDRTRHLVPPNTSRQWEHEYKCRLLDHAPLLLAAMRVAMANREMDSCVFVASSLRDAEWMGRWSRAHDEQNDARAAFEAELERE